jgi:D-alanine-D-alanine ligase
MKALKDQIVGVLMGGWSSERKISLDSGMKAAKSLKKQGFKVVEVDLGAQPNEARQALTALLQVDIVFIAMHGSPGEDGTVQGMLDVLRIPYTGSGVLASSICMDKIVTKKVLGASEIKVPRFVLFEAADHRIPKGSTAQLQAKTVKKELGPAPWMVKAVSSGSSLGIELVKSEKGLGVALQRISSEYGDLFVEEFMDGIEVQVGILGRVVLPAAEIRTRNEFFDYQAKYTHGITEEIIPAQLPDDIYKEVLSVALRSHKATGCRGFSRVDMIVRDSDVYVLEVNSIPGLTDLSLLPAEAAYIGMSYDDVIYKILRLADEQDRKRDIATKTLKNHIATPAGREQAGTLRAIHRKDRRDS